VAQGIWCRCDTQITRQVMPKKKREYTEEEMAQWEAEEAVKKTQRQSAFDSLAAEWTSQNKPFKSDFIGTYECDDVAAADLVRETLGIVVQSDAACPGRTPKPMESWADIDILPSWINRSLQEHGWPSPMPVQAQAFPILLAGRNLIGIAQTGSGKTIAFSLPALIHAEDQRPLARNDQGPIVLVLAPTRELAVQIAEETEKLTKYSHDSPAHPSGLRTTCFYGGGSKKDQLWRFSGEGSHIVVATPGRLLDCIAEGSVSLQRVTYFCLDEADRMLDMGFRGDMEQLSSTIRADRQMVFFSATWPKDVESLAHNLCTTGQPVTIRVTAAGKESEELVAREGIHQDVVIIEELPAGRGMDKWGKQDEIKKKMLDAHLKKVLASPQAKVMIFVNDKLFADSLANKLWEEGVPADCMHGGRPQERRLSILDCFRKGSLRVLVATDVVGRGLDIPDVTHVVVYSFNTALEYIHRIGRTGRGVDGTGHALVFFEYTPKNVSAAEELIDVLERSGQEVPPQLRVIADEVKSGIRRDFYKDRDDYTKDWQQGYSKTWQDWGGGW